MKKSILLVDDDELLRRSLAFSLQQVGYHVATAASAEDALALARREKPDLVLLDIGLPGMDGLESLRYFKDQLDIPVIFLTARRRELDEVVGLELGADDYVTKPFSTDVLLARIKLVMRRATGKKDTATEKDADIVIVGDLKIDPIVHTVTIADQVIDLRPREFDLLHTMALEPRRVFSVDDLLARVWGAEYIGQPQVVYVHIRWLREKIEADPKQPCRIITVRGVGYRLEPQEG